jgi:hypothetical protein
MFVWAERNSYLRAMRVIGHHRRRMAKKGGADGGGKTGGPYRVN